jgi:hypothetical protein
LKYLKGLMILNRQSSIAEIFETGFIILPRVHAEIIRLVIRWQNSPLTKKPTEVGLPLGWHGAGGMKVVTGVCSALLPSRFACCMRDWSFVALALGGNLTLYSLFVPAVLVCWEEEWHKEGNGGWPLLPSRIWGRADTRRNGSPNTEGPIDSSSIHAHNHKNGMIPSDPKFGQEPNTG